MGHDPSPVDRLRGAACPLHRPGLHSRSTPCVYSPWRAVRRCVPVHRRCCAISPDCWRNAAWGARSGTARHSCRRAGRRRLRQPGRGGVAPAGSRCRGGADCHAPVQGLAGGRPEGGARPPGRVGAGRQGGAARRHGRQSGAPAGAGVRPEAGAVRSGRAPYPGRRLRHRPPGAFRRCRRRAHRRRRTRPAGRGGLRLRRHIPSAAHPPAVDLGRLVSGGRLSV